MRAKSGDEICYRAWRILILVAFAAAVAAPVASSQSASSMDFIIAGTVCDANGKPVAGAVVRLEERGHPDVITQSGASGVFTLSGPGVGQYRISAEKSGLRSLSSTVSAASPGARKQIDLVLDQKSTAHSDTAVPSSSSPMQFADQPNFVVAGVSDWTAAGGHGSDATLRTSEALTRETITLKPQGAAISSEPVHDNAADLLQAREHVNQELAEKETADLDRQVAELDEKLGNPLAAVREYDRAAHLDPSEQNYFEWGSELLLHRAVWQSAQVFADGVKAYPRSVRMLAALGTALFSSARYGEAALRLCEASDLNPSAPELYLFMGKIEMAAPSPLPCVEEKLARFTQLQPNNALANYFYAMAIWKRQQLPPDQKDMQQVEALLNTAVRLDAKCADAYLQLGLLSFSKREYDLAIRDYTLAIAADPQLGEAHYRLGVAYDRKGETDKAKQEFQLHDEIEKSKADEIERQRKEVKQFLVVQEQPVSPPAK